MELFLVVVLAVLVKISGEELPQTIVSANNEFAADVYRGFAKKDNFIFSPFSAELVLALVQSGARGQTLEELSRALHLPDQESTKTAFESLLSILKVENAHFCVANKLYLRKNFTVEEDFENIAEVFDASVENVDFSNSAEAAESMNGWVGEKTNNKIKTLIDPTSITLKTEAIVINALYFKANWFDPFSESEKKNFHLLENGKIEVDFMLNTFSYSKYAENPELDAKFLQLYFTEEEFSMVFVLPSDKAGISRLEERINETLAPQSFTERPVHIEIPKFKIETEADFKRILKKLGVHLAFTKQADFSGITDSSMHISEIFQKTTIEVNKAGIEATSATYNIWRMRSMHISLPDDREFIADHPFIYYIKYKDLILFVGRVGVPEF